MHDVGSRLAPFRRERGGRRRVGGAPPLPGDLERSGGTRRLVEETLNTAILQAGP